MMSLTLPNLRVICKNLTRRAPPFADSADRARVWSRLNPPSPAYLAAQSHARAINPTPHGAADLGHRRYKHKVTLRFGPVAASFVSERPDEVHVVSLVVEKRRDRL